MTFGASRLVTGTLAESPVAPQTGPAQSQTHMGSLMPQSRDPNLISVQSVLSALC